MSASADTKEILKRKWDKGVDWNNLLPPSRPSNYHINVIRKHLATIDKNHPVAVLGSTPEFRDLYASLGFKNIFILDHSVIFNRRANELRCYSNKETLIVGEWLDTLKQHTGFAAILSDLTSGNIPYKDQEVFYQGISLSLRPDGFFIDKVLTNEAEFVPLDELDKKYAQLPYNLETLNYFSCEYFFCSELTKQFGMTDVNKFYAILDKRFKHPVLRKFLQNTLRITPRGGLWFYGKPWDHIRQNYFRNLKLIKSHLEPYGSPYYKRMRIIITSPKRA